MSGMTAPAHAATDLTGEPIAAVRLVWHDSLAGAGAFQRQLNRTSRRGSAGRRRAAEALPGPGGRFSSGRAS